MMNDHQTSLLDQYHNGKISKAEVREMFGDDIHEADFVKKEIAEAIKASDHRTLERAIKLIWLNGQTEKFLEELHLLLLEPNHYSHQRITKCLQDIGRPESIPFIEQVLKTNFAYLEYTGSDSRAIAKWFSWALYSIGTTEAINVIKAYTQSENEGVRTEMKYRLEKI